MGGTNQSFSTSLQKNLIEARTFTYMKKRFLIPCILLSFIATSQSDSLPKKKIVYGTSINQSLTRYGFPTALLFTLQYDKHEFSLGPQFRIGRSINKDQNNFGAEFDYRFYPLGNQHWFSPYLLANVSYFREFNGYYRTLYYPGNPENGKTAYLSEMFNHFAFNAGYGVNFNLDKSVYLGSNIGAGYLLSKYTSETKTVSGTYERISKSKDGYLGFVVSIYFGIRF